MAPFMARSMWRGAIQFGLVTIPVKLYLATETGEEVAALVVTTGPEGPQVV